MDPPLGPDERRVLFSSLSLGLDLFGLTQSGVWGRLPSSSSRPRFSLELSATRGIWVRTRDLVLASTTTNSTSTTNNNTRFVLPRCVFLAGAPLYDAAVLRPDRDGVRAWARIVPDPQKHTHTADGDGAAACDAFEAVARALARFGGGACVELATPPGESPRGLLFFSGSGSRAGNGEGEGEKRMDLGEALYVPAQIRDAPVLIALVRLPPASARPPAAGFFDLDLGLG